MKIVVVMDPVQTVILDEDTTYALIKAAEARGHEVFHCLAQDVGILEGQVSARLHRARTTLDPAQPITLQNPAVHSLNDVDAVLIRKDPPFDDAYLWLTLLLDRLDESVIVVNDPAGLRMANEKLYACHFPALMPKTLVTSDADAIRDFVERADGQGVIKPIDGHGGQGVFLLRSADPNFRGIVESVTLDGGRIAMVQEFIAEVREGDKRILLLDGKPLGAILRVPQAGDLRSNIHVGGAVVPTQIDAEDESIIEAMRPRLQQDGLYFVGLDVIGGKLTEVNVTSPTGIQQMSRFASRELSDDVMVWLEKRVR